VSLAWTVVSGSAAVAIGLTAQSVALVAFGSVGFVDGAGSGALAHHFHHAIRHDAPAERLERFAHRVVAIGLVIVGGAAIVVGALRVVDESSSDTTVVGVVLAAASFVVLLVLARAKHVVAPRVASPALRSDGHLSAMGAAQAAVACAGVAATAAGVSWADPAAGSVLGVAMSVVGVRSWRQSGDGRRS
jgi:divalent metal cation (Fe/Co/Zn/Cd) transporter